LYHKTLGLFKILRGKTMKFRPVGFAGRPARLYILAGLLAVGLLVLALRLSTGAKGGVFTKLASWGWSRGFGR
jgi:hypothetical protein